MIRFLLPVLAATLLVAQQPDVINGKIETRALNGPLAQEFHRLEASAASPLWMAYAFPVVPRQGTMCGNDEHNNIVRLEGSDTLLLLFRFENHALDRVRIYSFDCRFDAGGLPFVYLTGVQPSQSVDLLSSLLSASPHPDSIISAIALHRDPAAGRALHAMLGASQAGKIREKALFWLARTGGMAESGVIMQAAEHDPDAHVRRQAAFALREIPNGDGVPLLIQLAKTSGDKEVRRQAIFWLGQSRDPRATAFFAEVLK